MAVALVGAVGSSTRVTSGTTITSTYGQTPTANNLLVAVVSRVGSTATASPTSTGPGGSWSRLLPTNYVSNIGVGSATACTNLVDIWWKKATGSETNGDATFTMTLAGGTTTFALTCTIYELSGANTTTPLDVSGTQSSGGSTSTITTVTTTTSANVTATGEFAISAATRERAAVAPTITYSASWANGANDGATSSVAHTGVASLTGPSSGATASDVTTFSGSGTTAFSAGAIVVVAAAPPVATPAVLPAATQPAGLRAILWRTGLAIASIVPPPPVNPPPPAIGPQFYPQRAAVRAKQQPGPAGYTATVAVVGLNPLPTAPVPAPRLSQPVTIHHPLPRRGTTAGSRGAPVRNPTGGPPVRPLTAPVKARQPLFRLGRTQATTFTTQPVAVVHPAPLTPLPGPVRGRILQVFSRGRIARNAGARLNNPTTGPRFVLPAAETRSQLPAPHPRAGRVVSSPGAPVSNPTTGPRFVLPAGEVRSQFLPLHPRAGRVTSNPGAAVRNPGSGPAVRALTGPVKARQPLPPRGRTSGNIGAAVHNPVPPPPAIVGLARQVQAHRPLFLLGRVIRNAGAAVRNPTSGPVFRLPTAPVRARQPLPPHGRVTGGRGAPVQNPAPPAAAFKPLTAPVRARLPLWPLLAGRTGSIVAIPAPVAPVAGPAPLTPLQRALRAKPATFTKGRTTGSAGAPVRNPAPPPPAARPLTGPVQAHRPLPPVGRTVSRSGPPPVQQGPPFRPATAPVRARIPQTWAKGRAYGNVGAPVRNPALVQLQPLDKAFHAQPARFSKGRIVTSPKAPVRNPTTGPVFRLPTSPVRFRITLPPRGHNSGNMGAAVLNPASNGVITVGDAHLHFAMAEGPLHWLENPGQPHWETAQGGTS